MFCPEKIPSISGLAFCTLFGAALIRETFTLIDLVWHESLDYYSHRAINNHVSNLRHKLKVTPETPDYIRSVHSIGYKFNPNIELL